MSGIRCFVCIAALSISGVAVDAPKSEQNATSVASKPATRPNIVVITMDTTRADRMGFLGSKRGLTPNLDLIAGDSVVFTRAYSQAPFTPASHSTIFTGTYPQYHRVLSFLVPLNGELPYLPDVLKQHGYSTGAFVSSIATDPSLGVPGFERGYDTYDAGFAWKNYTPKTRYQTIERRANDTVAHALAWLDKHPQEPFFIWLHLFDAHSPYDPPEPYKTRYAKALYDGEIAYVDSALGKFFHQLKASGLYDDTVIAVTADHGESLGAHGENEHGIFVYEETIHVPLFIKLPDSKSAGKRVTDRVELADIMPSLLGTADIAVPDKVQGQSLLGFLAPGTPSGDAAARLWQDRGAYSTADYGHVTFGWAPAESLRSGKYLFIQAPRRELYDENADPGSLHNLASASPAVADALSARMKEFQQLTTNAGEPLSARQDDAKTERLAALGYVAGNQQSSAASQGDQGADPKDKVEEANILTRIMNIFESAPKQDWCRLAEPEIKKALVKIPNTSILHFFMGGCYLDKEDYANAVTELQAAVKLNPAFARAEANLGRALIKSGDEEGAMAAFEHVSKTAPGVIDVHPYLIVLYSKADRPQDVIRECRKLLEIFPRNFGANFNLGRALLETGDAQGAIEPLKKAMEGEPQRPAPHAVLGDVYDKLGRPDEAAHERAEAERLSAAMHGTGQQPPASDQFKPK